MFGKARWDEIIRSRSFAGRTAGTELELICEGRLKPRKATMHGSMHVNVVEQVIEEARAGARERERQRPSGCSRTPPTRTRDPQEAETIIKLAEEGARKRASSGKGRWERESGGSTRKNGARSGLVPSRKSTVLRARRKAIGQDRGPPTSRQYWTNNGATEDTGG